MPDAPLLLSRRGFVGRAVRLMLAALLALPLGAADALFLPSSVFAQDDAGAIVLPPQPDSGVQRGGGGGLFRLFRFEPRRQSRPDLTVLPEVETSLPQINLPPPKDPDARTVVVLGDEFADQLREGLVDRFEDERMIEALGVSIPGSGLTQVDELDWNIEALRRLDEYTQIGAVVVALGYSDRQTLIEGERRYAFGSPDWQDLYADRVARLALTLLTEGHRVLFVGLPPMSDPAMDADVRLINQVIESAVAPTRARFVEVYTGFVDVQGNYARQGPDMAGQVVDLRTSEGIFFNRAGREKYAHFVERFIPRDGQEAPEPEVADVVFEGSTRSPDGLGPVLIMTSGFSDPQATLAEDVESALADEPAVRSRLRDGLPLSAPTGRADNFAWPQ